MSWMNKKKFLRNGLIILHIIFASLGFYLYITSYNLSQKLLIQDTLNKQLLIAKSGSTSSQNLFTNVQNELTSFVFTFANIDENAVIDKTATRKVFTAYMQRTQLPINGIALYDETGKLVIIENRQDIRIGEGQDFSKTEFIQWSQKPLNKDKTFISSPYIGTTGASVGKIIFIFAKPIYFGTRYRGTLSIRILINDFGNAYIKPLTSGSDETSFIINKTGILLAGNSNLLNQNLFSYAKKNHWIGYNNFINVLKSSFKSNAIQTQFNFQYPNDKPQTYLVGISKIDVPDTDNDLYLAVLTPRNVSLSLLNPVRGYGLLWLGLGLLITIAGSIIVLLLQSY